jgi:predicted NUDIX family phosphoesterase
VHDWGIRFVERVFCIKRADLERVFHGELPQGSSILPNIDRILALNQFFLPRHYAEHNPVFKQIIPYQLFVRDARFLLYRRGGTSNETRLRGLLSAGIGGHINLDDTGDGLHLSKVDFFKALVRERNEESVCPDGVKTEFAGWINDDSDEVGRVHLGAVFICHLPCGYPFSIRPSPEDIHEEGWFRPYEIVDMACRCEKWTVLAIKLAMEKMGIR